MAAEIITVASLKGGVGKTTTSYALAAAAAACGLRVIAVDLDPTGGLSLANTRRAITIADVVAGHAVLEDALIDHPLGIKTVASDRSLTDLVPSEAQLRGVLASAVDASDIVLLDTHSHEPSLAGPMAVADRIIVPTALDILSLRAAALTVGLAQQLNVLDRIRGIVVTNVRRPMSRITTSLLDGLTRNGLAYETVLWHSPGWVRATSGRGEPPADDLLGPSKQLLREMAVRPAPEQALRQFIAMAQGRRPRAVAAGR